MRNRAIQKKLEQAELLVTLARHHVEWQRELIAELERKSVDTTDAVRLLAQFEHILDVHVAIEICTSDGSGRGYRSISRRARDRYESLRMELRARRSERFHFHFVAICHPQPGLFTRPSPTPKISSASLRTVGWLLQEPT